MHEVKEQMLRSTNGQGRYSSQYSRARGVNRASHQTGGESTAILVDALASENREIWAEARENLIKSSPKNDRSLNRIESNRRLLRWPSMVPSW